MVYNWHNVCTVKAMHAFSPIAHSQISCSIISKVCTCLLANDYLQNGQTLQHLDFILFFIYNVTLAIFLFCSWLRRLELGQHLRFRRSYSSLDMTQHLILIPPVLNLFVVMTYKNNSLLHVQVNMEQVICWAEE